MSSRARARVVSGGGGVQKAQSSGLRPARTVHVPLSAPNRGGRGPRGGLIRALRAVLRNREEPTALFGSLGPLGALIATEEQQCADAKRLLRVAAIASSTQPSADEDEDEDADDASASASDTDSVHSSDFEQAEEQEEADGAERLHVTAQTADQ